MVSIDQLGPTHSTTVVPTKTTITSVSIVICYECIGIILYLHRGTPLRITIIFTISWNIGLLTKWRERLSKFTVAHLLLFTECMEFLNKLWFLIWILDVIEWSSNNWAAITLFLDVLEWCIFSWIDVALSHRYMYSMCSRWEYTLHVFHSLIECVVDSLQTAFTSSIDPYFVDLCLPYWLLIYVCITVYPAKLLCYTNLIFQYTTLLILGHHTLRILIKYLLLWLYCLSNGFSSILEVIQQHRWLLILLLHFFYPLTP